MKRLYICRADKAGWDEYDGMVVRATSGQQAIEIAVELTKVNYAYDGEQNWSATTLHPEKGACEVVLASFNAG